MVPVHNRLRIGANGQERDVLPLQHIEHECFMFLLKRPIEELPALQPDAENVKTVDATHPLNRPPDVGTRLEVSFFCAGRGRKAAPGERL